MYNKILEYNVRHCFHEFVLGKYLSKTQSAVKIDKIDKFIHLKNQKFCYAR